MTEYPTAYEKDVVLEDGRAVLVRPVVPDDVVELEAAIRRRTSSPRITPVRPDPERHQPVLRALDRAPSGPRAARADRR